MPLKRDLTSWQAISIVVGVVIGTGIFLKTAVMAQQTGSISGVLLAWAVAGAMSLAGALVYAELAALFPETGGEYVFLREAYGSLPAFLYGWARFLIISPGSIAAYAVGSATFLNGVVPLGEGRTAFALGILTVFTVINCFAVAVGGRVQTLLTGLKVVLIGGLTAALFLFGNPATDAVEAFQSTTVGGPSAFGAAVLAALWAFDGWSNLPLAAGEVKNPERTLPRALAYGTLLVFLIYAAINLAYFYVLPLQDIVTSSSTLYPDAPSVAAKAASTALGPGAVSALSLMFVVSALGAMNASILTGARAPFAMARDGVFFSALGRIHPVSQVPVVAVIVQGLISAALVLMGTFDQLTDYVVFAAWIFYALVTLSLFIFRRRIAGKPRPFSTPLYPWLPAGFLLLAVSLLVNTLITSPKESGFGLLLIALGVPFYFYFHRDLKSN